MCPRNMVRERPSLFNPDALKAINGAIECYSDLRLRSQSLCDSIYFMGFQQPAAIACCIANIALKGFPVYLQFAREGPC